MRKKDSYMSVKKIWHREGKNDSGNVKVAI